MGTIGSQWKIGVDDEQLLIAGVVVVVLHSTLYLTFAVLLYLSVLWNELSHYPKEKIISVFYLQVRSNLVM